MSVDINIKKDLGNFKLDIEWKSESKRIGILGASGSGKSLTLKSIAGIETPDDGFIKTDGRVLFDKGKKINIIPQKRKTGYMFQSLALFENMSVEKNIKAGAGKYADEKTRDIMDKFGLADKASLFPSQLSQGQKQRTALARIIASEPDTILLDEPFSSLDRHIRDEVQTSLIDMLKNFKGTVITVSHSFDEIYALCDELIVIDKGRVCACGKTEDIFSKPPNRVSAMLTGWENIAFAESREDCIYIPDWDIKLPLYKKDVSYAAIRSNSFSLTDKGDMLCFCVGEHYIKRGPFDCTVYFKPSEKTLKKMCFKLPSYEDIPSKIYLDKKDILIIS